MSERGEYRSIRRVLLDGQDFQQLPMLARWVFIALKIGAGPTGIEVRYPEALAHELAAQTGADVCDVSESLCWLEERGWIRRQANVIWIVGHLAHDPHMSAKDKKHRKSVHGYLSGLPRLALVREFITAQPEWFPLEDASIEGLQWAIEGPSKGQPSPNENSGKGPRSSESESERESETESESEARAGEPQASPPPDRAAPRADAPAEPPLPQDATRFLATFYGAATPRRYREVERQLHAILLPSGLVYENAVLRTTPVRLAAKCRAVLVSAVREDDKAIAILLKKLSDTSDDSAPGQQQAKADERTEHLEERETAADEQHALAWLADQPDLEARIGAAVADQVPETRDDALGLTALNRRILRKNLLLKAWRAAGAPRTAQAAAGHTADEASTL